MLWGVLSVITGIALMVIFIGYVRSAYKHEAKVEGIVVFVAGTVFSVVYGIMVYDGLESINEIQKIQIELKELGIV